MEVWITATLVIDKLLGLLIDDRILSQGILDPEVFHSLEIELSAIHPLIKDVYERGGVVGRAWLEQVAEVAQRLEFVTDSYLLRMVHRSNQPDFIIKLKSGRSIASEVQDIVGGLRRVIHAGAIYGLFILQPGSRSSICVDWFSETSSSFFVKESEVVGIDSQKTELLSALVGGPSTRLVYSLVGYPGVGKTTLARIVFRKAVMLRHFDFCAWIKTPQSYDLEEVLRDLTTQICSTSKEVSVGKMHLEELRSRFRRYLSMKRYLIVFDDVRERQFWEDMNHVLPNNNKGSRIIIATRHDSIANLSGNIGLNLPPLSHKRALELFCKRAFQFHNQGNCPPELMMVSHEFVFRCRGLPRVITFLADFLSAENKVVSKWIKLLDHFNDKIVEVPFPRVGSVFFSSSYYALPYHIRPCFLYFGILPKDCLVPELKLLNLWIAEGFVKEEMGKTLEQVAATYLNELINRNVVQVSYIGYYGDERMCRIDASVHDVILSRAEEFKIFQTLSSRRISRHLSLYNYTKNIFESVDYSLVRSVFLVSVNKPVSKSFLVNLFESCKLLELLDFENTQLGYFPNEVGNLFYLKYLGLRNTLVKKLPKSIGLLLNLETLDARNTLIHDLPIQVSKLQKLRHLLASTRNYKPFVVDSIHGVRIKEGIGCLENLQTLLIVDALSSGFGVMEELEKLRQLRCLSISKLTTDKVNTLFASIVKMNYLESLSIYSSNGGEVFDLESLSSSHTPPSSLRRLILKCRLEKLPDWILLLQNLCILSLSFSRLAIDPLKALYCLSNLESLWLHQAYIGEQLHFEEGCFRKLKQLVLTELYDLRAMRIEEGALPLLEELRIGPSPDDLSPDIQHLAKLKLLEYYDMPGKFVLRLQPEGGLDYWKVKHVPSVRFWFRVEGRSYMLYKLGEQELLDHLQGIASNMDDAARREVRSSFYYSDGDDDSPTWNDINRLSFSSGKISFFSDDIED